MNIRPLLFIIVSCLATSSSSAFEIASAGPAAAVSDGPYGYPIKKLISSAQVWDEIVVVEIEKSELKLGSAQYDDSIETTMKVVDALKGSLRVGDRVVATSSIQAYPYDPQAVLTHAPLPGHQYLTPLFKQGGAWTRWAPFTTELSKPFQQDPYYLDFKTAQARLAGSSQVFRQKAPFISQAQAEANVRAYVKEQIRKVYGAAKTTQWTVLSAQFDEDAWSLKVRYWASTLSSGTVGFDSALLIVDAENGRVIEEIID